MTLLLVIAVIVLIVNLIQGRRGLKSIRLAFVRAHVTAGGFPSPGTRLAALVRRQEVPRKVTAASGIAGVQGRAPSLQRHCLRGTPVAVQSAEVGIRPIEIP